MTFRPLRLTLTASVIPGTNMWPIMSRTAVYALDGTLVYMTPVTQHQIVSGSEDFNTGVIPCTHQRADLHLL